MKPIFLVLYPLFGLFFLLACEEKMDPCEDTTSLTCFIDSHAERAISKNLIACAAGGQVGFLENPDFPVSVFYYPIPGASEYKYFETDDLNANPDDFSAYKEKILEDRPVFNGYLRRFLNTPSDSEAWGRVVYFTPDSIHISNAIRLKELTKPSEFAPQNVQIDLSTPTEPLFSWEDGRTAENAIYFQVVSSEAGDLISGTYTFEKNFRFYDLSNVVLNIRDVTPAPTLTPGSTYNFTLMGVSEDNWVNLIADSTFVAE